ncbi:MAG TPA: glutathione peroxidase [Solimonas sp.]|nr:glutathione peroxidase [Solimonas sp.]
MRLTLALLLFSLAPSAFAACQPALLDKTERRLTGGEENLCQAHGGKVVLVVNTASKCGFTPQYEGLEALYKTYQAQGLVVLGFPSDQFMNQEYSSDEEIAKFCKLNYGVSFPMYRKSDVKGDDANPLFRDLKAATGEAPSWNFNKYLISRDGQRVQHFGSRVKPDDPAFVAAIRAELTRKAP